jgi:proteasome lid subunit RPN8/RPN11
MSEVAKLNIELSEKCQSIIEKHCFENPDIEVGGFLLGKIKENYVEILGVKPALKAQSGQTNLTITHEAWAEVLDTMDADFPGMQIVGWYHSHPGFGCFLSEYDIFIQENFFGSNGQHALVVDPLEGTYAFFVVEKGNSVEVSSGKTKTKPKVRAADAKSSEKVPAAILAAEERKRTSSVKPVVVAIMSTAVVVGAIGWFLGNVQGQGSRELATSPEIVIPQPGELEVSTEDAGAAADEGEPAIELTEGAFVVKEGEVAQFSFTYTVQPGDSWWAIAQRYFGSGERFEELKRSNPQIEDGVLQPGDGVKVNVEGSFVAPTQEATS